MPAAISPRTLATMSGGRPAGAGADPTPHTLRHTCVTWPKQEGVPGFDVAGVTGMSKAMVDRVYGEHDPNHRREVADASRAEPERRAQGRIIDGGADG